MVPAVDSKMKILNLFWQLLGSQESGGGASFGKTKVSLILRLQKKDFQNY